MNENNIYAGYINRAYSSDNSHFQLRLEKIYNIKAKTWKDYAGKKRLRQDISFYLYDRIKFEEDDTQSCDDVDNANHSDDDIGAIVNELYETTWAELSFDILRQVLTGAGTQQTKVMVFQEQSSCGNLYAGLISKLYPGNDKEFELVVKYFYNFDTKTWKDYQGQAKLKRSISDFYYDRKMFKAAKNTPMASSHVESISVSGIEAQKFYLLRFHIKRGYVLKPGHCFDKKELINDGQNALDDQNDGRLNPILFTSRSVANACAKAKFKELVWQFFRDMRHGRPPKAKHAYEEIVDGDETLAAYKTHIHFKTSKPIEYTYEVHVWVQFLDIKGDTVLGNEYSDSSSGEDDDPNINFGAREDY